MAFWDAFNKWRNKEGAELGETVVMFQCNGCMASDHVLKWIGEITAFEAGAAHMSGYNYAVVKIIKRDSHEDSRDTDLGTERIIVEDGSFQRLGTSLLAVFK